MGVGSGGGGGEGVRGWTFQILDFQRLASLQNTSAGISPGVVTLLL